MGIYEIGKDMQNLQSELEAMRAILQQVYGVVEHNIKTGRLIEPKEEKK